MHYPAPAALGLGSQAYHGKEAPAGVDIAGGVLVGNARDLDHKGGLESREALFRGFKLDGGAHGDVVRYLDTVDGEVTCWRKSKQGTRDKALWFVGNSGQQIWYL